MERRFLLFTLVFCIFNLSDGWSKAMPYSLSFNWNRTLSSMIPYTESDPNGCQFVVYQDDYDYITSLNTQLSSLGQSIGSGSHFNSGNFRMMSWTEITTTPTVFTNPNCVGKGMTQDFYNYYYTTTTYFGFSVVQNGLTYYGWFAILNGSVTAYLEDIAGFSIQVGDTKGFQSYPSNYLGISGTVYLDNDLSGSYNIGDVGVSNETVSLSGTVYTTVTDINGAYTFWVPQNLVSGSADALLKYPSWYVYNTPPNGRRAVTFPLSSNISGIDFGINYDATSEPYGQVIVSFAEGIRHRRCFKSSTVIKVQNNSNISMTNVPVTVEIPDYTEVLASQPAYQSLQNKVAKYIIPSIAAQSYSEITLTDSIVCGIESIRGTSVCYRATVDLPYSGSDIFPYYACQDSVHLFKLVNKGNGVMTDSLVYKIFLDNVLQGTYNYKTNGTDTFYVQLPNDGRSVRMEVFQSPTNTRTNMRYIISEGCASTNSITYSRGLADQIESNDQTSYFANFCFLIRDSFDPNDLIVSPTGWGATNNILQDQQISYRIDFQNTGTAPAVSIAVVDTLDSNLDASTIRVLERSAPFRCESMPLPDGRFRFTVIFTGINLPDSSHNEPASHGYIEFSIMPKTNLAIGTQIKNTAFIYFDYNSYIATNTVLQTIAAPETVSNPLSVKTSGATFDVTDQTLTYGDAPTAPILITNAGTAGLMATSSNPAVVTFESGKLVIHESGSANLNYRHQGNEKYLPVPGIKTRVVTVNKATLTIIANSYQRLVGQSNPVLEWIAQGFAYNETDAVLQGYPELICSADVSSVIGDYPININAGTQTADNYDITYMPGILSVVEVTNIQDLQASGISIYPVPSKDGHLTVNTAYEKLDHITLTDINGRTESFDQQEINSQLQGVVVIRIYTDRNVYSSKVELTK